MMAMMDVMSQKLDVLGKKVESSSPNVDTRHGAVGIVNSEPEPIDLDDYLLNN